MKKIVYMMCMTLAIGVSDDDKGKRANALVRATTRYAEEVLGHIPTEEISAAFASSTGPYTGVLRRVNVSDLPDSSVTKAEEDAVARNQPIGDLVVQTNANAPGVGIYSLPPTAAEKIKESLALPVKEYPKLNGPISYVTGEIISSS